MGTNSVVGTTPDCGNHALPQPAVPGSEPEEPDEPPCRNQYEGHSTRSEYCDRRHGQDLEMATSSISETQPGGEADTYQDTINDTNRVPSYMDSIRALVMYSWINILLVFIPLSFALHYTVDLHHQDVALFVFSALGIIPLAGLLGFATEQVSVKTNDTIGGLVNASMGNVVELIVAAIGLRDCDIALVQSTLLGGLLSNLLLVLGMSFVVGGFRFHHQRFQAAPAQVNSTLMTVAVISILVPTAFSSYAESRLRNDPSSILQTSRAAAIVLILVYAAYVAFQFFTHQDVFSAENISDHKCECATVVNKEDSLPPVHVTITSPKALHVKMNTPVAFGTLALCTILAYFTAEHLVQSLDAIVEHSNVSKEWLTLIVIPIVSNAAEHATAVVVAAKGRFELALTIAIGSCVQIALFVIPVLVLVAWGLGKPLSLIFDPLETLCLFLSVLVVKFSVEDGRSHWLNGTLLLAVYVLIAISFWGYPQQSSVFVCT